MPLGVNEDPLHDTPKKVVAPVVIVKLVPPVEVLMAVKVPRDEIANNRDPSELSAGPYCVAPVATVLDQPVARAPVAPFRAMATLLHMYTVPSGPITGEDWNAWDAASVYVHCRTPPVVIAYTWPSCVGMMMKLDVVEYAGAPVMPPVPTVYKDVAAPVVGFN